MKNRINSITIIAGSYPYKNQMTFVFVQQLVHALIDMKIKVTVVASQSIIHALMYREKVMPTHYKEVTEKGIEYDVYRPYTLSFGNNNPFKKLTSWYNKKAITALLKKINSDVLYSHFWSSALSVYEYTLKKEIPLFVACGEGDDAIENMIGSISKDELKKLSCSVSGVISVSTENKMKCIKYGLANEENIDIFPNCVNTDLFKKKNTDNFKKKLGIKEKDFVVCFVGGFIPRKGPDRIAKAIKQLNDNQIKVMFIGKEFSGYSFDFDCSGIIFKGAVSHNDLPLYLNCADVFVMPTLKEGCCNAIVEALACGLPVISSDRSFNYDILNENNSIMIDPMNINEIASAIKRLKNDATLRSKMSEYSHARHDEYSICSRAVKILNFINSKK